MAHRHEDIISLENLLAAWREFLRGKRKKPDVQFFSLQFFEHIHVLGKELKDGSYRHGAYRSFSINDPKPRIIHKASVRDRLLHHAVYRILYPYFERKFIADSYSCQRWKGMHKAIKRLTRFAGKAGSNHTRTCWVLKCDIRKFFASIDQAILLEILGKWISDPDILSLLKNIVRSFHSAEIGKGLPLGNLTSQLLVNVYMNEFDQWMKHTMKVKYYIRYADDFVILDHDKGRLTELLPKIAEFLTGRLKLSLHPDKVSIKTFASGVDFLGWVHFPHHRVLRRSTKRRMLKKIYKDTKKEIVQSYIGLLSHGNGYTLKKKILEIASPKM